MLESMGKKSGSSLGVNATSSPSKLSAQPQWATVEAAVLGLIARKKYKRATHNAELRKKVVREIIGTEKSYLQSVECIVLDYLEAIRNTFPPLLPADSIPTIFGKIEDIFLINKQLFEQLTTGSEDKVSKKIGDIFLNTAPYLKLYSEYCKNYPIAVAKFRKHLEEERFSLFIKKLRGDGSILDLPSLLIQPVQRIPRYKLLLIELLKRTETIDPDFNNLNVALDKVSEVADHINNVIKERQNVEMLLSIQKKLTGTVPPIVIPRRVFLREGSLMKVCRKVSKKRWIYGSTVDTVGKYKFHRLQNLHGGKVKDVPDKPKHKNAFQIICKEKSFTVFASTLEEKQSWYSSFESAFNNINYDQSAQPTRLSKHYSYSSGSLVLNTSLLKLPTTPEESESAPVWVPDSDAERCMICSAKFTAFKRRHHCRKCGKVVCAKCSNYSYKLDNLNKTARVCASCFKELTQTSPHSVSLLPSSESYENLVDFCAHFGDAAPPPSTRERGKGGGMVAVTVKRINASEKGVGMVKGKVLAPQTRKAQRRVLYNITNTVTNGGEKEEHNGNGTDNNPTDNPPNHPPPNSLPPLPVLPTPLPRHRMTLASSSSANLTPPMASLHGHSPNLRSINYDRRASTDSVDTTHSLTDISEDLSSLPSLSEEPHTSPKSQSRSVAVGN